MKWIIDLPEQITIDEGIINIRGNVGWSAIEKAVHKATPHSAEVEDLKQFQEWIQEKDRTDPSPTITYTEVLIKVEQLLGGTK